MRLKSGPRYYPEAWFSGRALPILTLIGSLSAFSGPSETRPQTVGECFGTAAMRIQMLAGSNLRFPIPVESIAKASAKLSLGKPSLNKPSRWLHARVRPGRDFVTSERPGVFFMDLYSTVDAAPGEIEVSLPITAYSGQGGKCHASTAKWRFTVEVLAARRLSKAELAAVAARLEGPLDTYTHRDFVHRTDGNGSRRFSLVRFDQIRARILLRDEPAVPPTERPYFADEQGNIGRLGNLARGSGWAPIRYGVVFFPAGGSTLAIDASGDGIVDLALGGRGGPWGRYGRWWIETNAFGEGFFECWAAQREWTPELRGEVAAAVSTSVAGPCSRGGAGAGGGGGGGVGSFGLPGAALLGPPDCSFTESPLGGVTDDGPSVDELLGPEQTDEEFAEMIEAIRTEMENAAALREAEAVEAAMAAERIAEEARNEALWRAPPAPPEGNAVNDTVRALQRVGIIHETESSTLRVEPGIRGSIRDCAGVCPGVIFESRQEGDDDEPPRHVPPHRPPIGPDDTPAPDFQDPRCAGIAVDAARGTLFTNPHFCGGSTLLDCLLREQDSIYDITGGNCRREVGPDDAIQLVCGDNRSFFPDCTPTEPADRRCEDRCGPGDVYCRNVAGTGPPFLSLTPIGGLLEVICHADCPTEPF